ncbi:MAG TPA: tetratricopeptide repeat protein [Thermoanaerobaculia bacterium]|nr:tetratricopeptide repeat protein [Thermoanaerobaculia bacterium]
MTGLRLPILLFLLWSAVPLVALPAQEAVSALPPPVTRSLYRSHWFELLNALDEDDARAAATALQEMKKAAQTVGVHRLSDFSRTAVYEARKAEAQGRQDRAARAFAAALELDGSNYDARVSRIEFLLRRRSFGEAVRSLPAAGAALLETQEARLALSSSLALWIALAVTATVLGSIVALLLWQLPRITHDLQELAARFGGRGALPLALILLALPLAFGLGPVWVVLYWAALLCAYAERWERSLLLAGLAALGLLAPLLIAVSRENILERSPLYVAAVDLEERREDASAEDGLRQASAVFSGDPDVWFLLGMYAERSGDSERALLNYERAIEVGPKDYRPFLNIGNVHFQEGDYGEAIRDYIAAGQRAPDTAEIYYNLAIARAETYDFEGQAAALAKARQISDRDVAYWSDHPTLARVVSARYTLSRARQKIEEWNAQPKGRRLPGHTPPLRLAPTLLTPLVLGPWAALLLAVGLTAVRSRWPIPSECARCGEVFCPLCKRIGGPLPYCASCVRLHARKETAGIEAQVTQVGQLARRTRQRDRLCRVISVLLPGAHRLFSQKPGRGALTLFLFFLFVAASAVDQKAFDPRQLPPPNAWHLKVYIALLAAAGVWAGAQWAAWKESHGA